MRILKFAVILAFVAGVAVAQPTHATGDSFYDAIRTGNRTRLAALIKTHGTSIADAQGLTPLMMAAAVGTTDAMRALLMAGAEVRSASPSGVTALHLAITDIDKTRLLVDAGADVSIPDGEGVTALEHARTAGYGEIVAVLTRAP